MYVQQRKVVVVVVVVVGCYAVVPLLRYDTPEVLVALVALVSVGGEISTVQWPGVYLQRLWWCW
jgi:hypothetical protein